MARAPFQVLIIPYRPSSSGGWEYLLLRRADAGYWQPVAGGGEDGESQEEAARREAWEEAGIPPEAPFLRLDATETIRVTEFKDSPLWGDAVYVIPQTCFGAAVPPDWNPVLSREHTQAGWFSFPEAHSLLRFDANRTALWELDRRLRGLGPRGVESLERAGYGFLPAAWQTNRLVVRDARLGDAAPLHTLFNACSSLADLDPTFSPVPLTDLQALVLCSLAAASQGNPAIANEFRLQAVFRRGGEQPGELVGYFHLSHSRPQPELVWVSMFVIAPQTRRQGVGTELANALADRLQSLGYAAIRLRVFLTNLSALHFWTQQGFRRILQVEPTGAIILERRLNEA